MGNMPCPVKEAYFSAVFSFWFSPIALFSWKNALFAYLVKNFLPGSIFIDFVTAVICWWICQISKPIMINHSHKKRKDSLETRAVLSKLFLELEIYGVAVQCIHQNSEKWQRLLGTARWKWLWSCFSHVLLLWPWCQGFWGSVDECYRSKRVSQMLLVCHNLLNSQNISTYQSINNEK